MIILRNVGLVLSGGMARGACQIGALKAIRERFEHGEIKYVSAASVGALNTYAYLTNNLDKAIDLWNEVSSTGNREWITALLKSSLLQNAIKTIMSDTPFESNFYVPYVNLLKRTLSYVDLSSAPHECMEDYLRASVAMPIYNSAVTVRGEPLYDGAMVDNIPIYPLLKHPLDYILCIYFDNQNYTFENEYLSNKVIKMNFSDNKILSHSVFIRKESVSHMIDDGYGKACRVLDYVFVNGKDDLESIYARIEDLNEIAPGGSLLRITGDVIVNNMNKVTKRLIKKKKIVK